MKHSKKADEILGNNFWQRTFTLSNSKQAALRSLIDHLIDSNEPDAIVKECAYEFALMDFDYMAGELLALKHKQISDGIEWLGKQGRWTDLSAIAKHAMENAITAAQSDEKGELGKRQAKHYELDLQFLRSGISDYKAVIDTMKETMLNEGVMHWLHAIQNDPDSNHAESWRRLAKKLIIELLDMDDIVNLFFEGSSGKLSIYKDSGNYQYFGTVNHWTVVYGDPAPEYGEDAFNACGSEYFHLERKELAVECLINRYLKEPSMIHVGSGSQSLEEIKNSNK